MIAWQSAGGKNIKMDILLDWKIILMYFYKNGKTL